MDVLHNPDINDTDNENIEREIKKVSIIPDQLLQIEQQLSDTLHLDVVDQDTEVQTELSLIPEL